MTASGEVEVVSQQILTYFGKTVTELNDWVPLIHTDERELVIRLWSHSVETGEPYNVEQRLLRADSVFRWFLVRGHPLRNTEGRIVRWYILLTDIEDRKHAEEALRASEHKFRQIVDSIPGLICTEIPGAGSNS